jgi:hypothetical protein
VAAGILLSRIIGLVRLRVFSHYFGLRSDSADAFNAAFRIPNFLQNLFGEGVLSASFIPGVCALAGRRRGGRGGQSGGRGGRDAGAGGRGIVPGRRAGHALADRHHRAGIFGIEARSHHFPGANSLSRRGFAGVFGLVPGNSEQPSEAVSLLCRAGDVERGDDRDAGDLRRANTLSLAMDLAWGSVAGSALQFGIQLPVVLRLARHLRMRLDLDSGHVRTVIRNFAPVFVSRGVVQISAYIDALLASLLPTGAVTGLINAQLIYVLPVSLFGMSVSAAELPVMSSATGSAGGNSSGAARASGFRIAAHRVLHCSVGRGVSRVRRSDRGRAVANRPLHAHRCAICLGHSGGIFGWIAGVHHGAIVFVGLLRVARHSHAIAIRRFARRAHHRSRIHLREAAAAVDRDRSALGRGGIDGVGGSRRMGGVCAIAARAASEIGRAPWSISGFVAKLWLAAALGRWLAARGDCCRCHRIRFMARSRRWGRSAWSISPLARHLRPRVAGW